MIVLVEGNISASKSTVVQALDGEKFPEPLEKENPFLSLFYKDPKRYGTEMQLYTLMYRYRQWKEAQARGLNNPDSIFLLDRSLFFDACFAKVNRDLGNISDDEWRLYFMAHETLQEQIYFPDLCIWLRVSPEVCLERIKLRNRGCETGVSLEYLKQIEAAYCEVMSTFRNKCLVIEVNGEQTREKVLEDCKKAIALRKETLNSSWPRWKGGL